MWKTWRAPLRVMGKHSCDPDTAAMGPLSAWANYLIKEKKDVECEGREMMKGVILMTNLKTQ